MILRPRIKKAEKDGDDPSVFFGIEHIFAYEDTDGPELAELEYPDLDGPGNQAAYDRLLAYAAAEGLTVTDTPDHPTEAKGYYSAKRKIIYIEPANPAQMLRVAALGVEEGETRRRDAGLPGREACGCPASAYKRAFL